MNIGPNGTFRKMKWQTRDGFFDAVVDAAEIMSDSTTFAAEKKAVKGAGIVV